MSEETDRLSRYPVTRAMLPVHCPTPEMSLWNAHPKVYLPIQPHQETCCPYCGTVFFLQDETPAD